MTESREAVTSRQDQQYRNALYAIAVIACATEDFDSSKFASEALEQIAAMGHFETPDISRNQSNRIRLLEQRCLDLKRERDNACILLQRANRKLPNGAQLKQQVTKWLKDNDLPRSPLREYQEALALFK